jgi:hypothetical protein
MLKECAPIQSDNPGAIHLIAGPVSKNTPAVSPTRTSHTMQSIACCAFSPIRFSVVFARSFSVVIVLLFWLVIDGSTVLSVVLVFQVFALRPRVFDQLGLGGRHLDQLRFRRFLGWPPRFIIDSKRCPIIIGSKLNQKLTSPGAMCCDTTLEQTLMFQLD